jgi:hypothetical protein
MSIRRLNKSELILDKYGRKCVDCGGSLYLRYLGPLKESHVLCELSDDALDWIDKYAETGASSEDDAELYKFLSEMMKLGTPLDSRSLSTGLSGAFEDAKQRGFLNFLGADDKTGEYTMICPNRQCAKHRMGTSSTYPKHPDQRGKHININEDGSQDKFEKLPPSRSHVQGEAACPACGTPTLVRSYADPETGNPVFTCSNSWCGNEYVRSGKGGYERFYF